MGANRLEKYEITTMNRADIKKAPYNPRVITEEAAKKLRKNIRESGMLAPPIVNKRTGNIVSGHQRITQMDTLLKKDDYTLTVALVDMDEQEEIKANIFLNNKAAQGEYDYDMLADIAQQNPEIDWLTDIGFDAIDYDLITQQLPEADFSELIAPVETDFEAIDSLKSRKAEQRAKARQENRNTANAETGNYTLTFVFPSTDLKRAVCRGLGIHEAETMILTGASMSLGLSRAALEPVDQVALAKEDCFCKLLILGVGKNKAKIAFTDLQSALELKETILRGGFYESKEE